MVNFPATGAGFSSITSVRERIERLSSAGRLTRIPIGTMAASSARRGASSVTRPEPSRIGRPLKISSLMLFQVSSEGCVECGAGLLGAAAGDAAARPSAIITAETDRSHEIRHGQVLPRSSILDNPGGTSGAATAIAAAGVPSLPFQFAESRDGVARIVLVEHFPARSLALAGAAGRLRDRRPRAIRPRTSLARLSKIAPLGIDRAAQSPTIGPCPGTTRRAGMRRQSPEVGQKTANAAVDDGQMPNEQEIAREQGRARRCHRRSGRCRYARAPRPSTSTFARRDRSSFRPPPALSAARSSPRR